MPRYKPAALGHGVFKQLTQTDLTFVLEYIQDYNPRRAALVAGLEPEDGYKYRKRPEVVAAMEVIMSMQVEAKDIDPEWVLIEAKENLYIARQKGQIPAANAALKIIANHCDVDAFAAEKLNINTADDVVERLQRARSRTEPKNDKPSFL